MSERTNDVKPVLSATPLGGAIGNHTPVQPLLTVQASEVVVSSESTYAVSPDGATKPGDPSRVAVARVVADVGAAAVAVGDAAGGVTGVRVGVAVAPAATGVVLVAPPHATMPNAAMARAQQRVKVRMPSSLAARCERVLKRRPGAL